MLEKNKLVVANAGWAETIPEWLKEACGTERFVMEMTAIMTGKTKEEVGDSEACIYLYTHSLTAPMSHDLNEIYIWLTGSLLKKLNMDVPDFALRKLEEGLTPDQDRELNELKRELYRKRGGTIKTPVLDMMRSLKKMKK